MSRKKFGIKFLDNRGIMLVWFALFMLPLLIIFAGLAIDIAYMYHAKNQLQVAADAAALAGAANLADGSVSVTQDSVREQAWKFACKNKAAGVTPGTNVNGSSNNVYLANNSGTSCDTPPAGSLLNEGNDPAGDIVLGNWLPTRATSPVDLRFLPVPGNPLPAGAAVNAVKVVARRTGADAVANISSGNNSVHVFLGQIFRMIGTDWSFMSATASAVATRPPGATSFVAFGSGACLSGCTYPTECPITVNTDCVAARKPYQCCTGPGTGTCRVLFLSGSHPLNEMVGWTSLLQKAGNASAFSTLMCNNSPYENICGSPGTCGSNGIIWGVNGTSDSTLQDYESLMYDPGFDSGSKEITGGVVTGWTVFFPWQSTAAGPDPMAGSGDCGAGGFSVQGYIKVHIIAVCATGTTGCRGHSPPSGTCNGPNAYPNHTIVIDSMSCISCDAPALGPKPALVR